MPTITSFSNLHTEFWFEKQAPSQATIGHGAHVNLLCSSHCIPAFTVTLLACTCWHKTASHSTTTCQLTWHHI